MKKNKLFVLFILVILILICIIFSYKYFSIEKEVNEEKIFTEQVPKMFAIMIEDKNEEGSFVASDSNTWPAREEGYLFNEEKSMCVNSSGNVIASKFEQNLNNQVRVSGLKETAYCYVYFDYIDLEKFCEEKTDKLSDCILMIENTSYNLDSAKKYIESKGSATTSKVAPTIIYQEAVSESEKVYANPYDYLLGSSYVFDEKTGYYTVQNPVYDKLSDKYIDYYTCGVVVKCTTMYKIKEYEIQEGLSATIQRITKSIKYSYKKYEAFDSEIGLYAADDEEGRTYFYRGAVKNNYVSYAGFIWRIVRINGDGSIRMIYSGTSTDDTGNDVTIGTSFYNNTSYDPRFVGYTYGTDTVERESKTAWFLGFTQNYSYYFSKGYTKTDDGSYILDQNNLISGTWSEIHEQVLQDGYIYSCRKMSSTAKCEVLIKIEGYAYLENSMPYQHQASVKYISKDNSKDYNSALVNGTESLIKIYIDTWYENNIKDKTDVSGNLLSDYLYDGIFCNDRSIRSGDGYLLSTYTYYNAFGRINSGYKPTFNCAQDIDEFSVAKGNLKYPISLLTIDEAAYAGLRNGQVNNQFYLYSGESYWTMTPGLYSSQFYGAYVYHITTNGNSSYNQVHDSARGVRPVINLKADVNYVSGKGTKESPYQISID